MLPVFTLCGGVFIIVIFSMCVVAGSFCYAYVDFFVSLGCRTYASFSGQTEDKGDYFVWCIFVVAALFTTVCGGIFCCYFSMCLVADSFCYVFVSFFFSLGCCRTHSSFSEETQKIRVITSYGGVFVVSGCTECTVEGGFVCVVAFLFCVYHMN